MALPLKFLVPVEPPQDKSAPNAPTPERAAPRTEVANKVFTSTEFAADQPIPLHHEMSYSHNWPSRLYFYCEEPAAEGGTTPLASVFRRKMSAYPASDTTPS